MRPRSLRTTFSQVVASLATCAGSSASSARPPAFARVLWTGCTVAIEVSAVGRRDRPGGRRGLCDLVARPSTTDVRQRGAGNPFYANA